MKSKGLPKEECQHALDTDLRRFQAPSNSTDIEELASRDSLKSGVARILLRIQLQVSRRTLSRAHADLQDAGVLMYEAHNQHYHLTSVRSLGHPRESQRKG